MAKIRLFATDIDGTMTNGHMTFHADGSVAKSYHTRDCTALWLLKNTHGVDVVVITGSNHPCDRHRFHYLHDHPLKPLTREEERGLMVARKEPPNTHLIQAVPFLDKHLHLEAYMEGKGITWDEVAYIGDAENDTECLKRAGFPACPKDAVEEVKRVCWDRGIVCEKRGGQGAVYEFAEVVREQNAGPQDP